MKKWIKVETTIDDLLAENDVKRIFGYEDGFVYVELREPNIFERMYEEDKTWFEMLSGLLKKMKKR